MGFLDTPGDEFGILPTLGGSANPYYTAGTGGCTPGVIMANLPLVPTTASDFSVLDATLQNYWKFDEGSGTSATDNGLAGQGKTGTLSNTTWTGNGYLASEMNNGLSFNGSSKMTVSSRSPPRAASPSRPGCIRP